MGNKNVILITIDSLRADHVSFLGYPRNTTPFMDKIAEQGVVFTNAISNAHNTSTSFPAILSSTYTLMYPDCATHYFKKLSHSRTMIAEILKENGYATGAFHSNPLLTKYYGYNRGFDTFEDLGHSEIQEDRIKFSKSSSENDRKSKKNPTRTFFKNMLSKNKFLFKQALRTHYILFNRIKRLPYAKAELINKKALDWLDGREDNFLTWIHYMDPHYPYMPSWEHLQHFSSKQISHLEMSILWGWASMAFNPDCISEKDLKKVIDLYDGEIRYLDEQIHKLIKELKKRELFDNSLIIITADHGEQFKEHGGFSHWPKLYDELIHVPLLILAPGIKTGTRIEELVQHLDIAPTILDYLAINAPQNFRGNSLIPLVNGSNFDPSKGVISETLYKGRRVSTDGTGYKILSYRTKKWKYIFDEGTKQDELYDLERDPKEKQNISKSNIERCREFEDKIRAHILMEEEIAKKPQEKDKISRIVGSLKIHGNL
jgi:arylsulfatase A-like enzyme